MIRTAPPPEQRFVFYGVSWAEYEGLLRAFGDRRLRHAYDRGTLEITSPSRKHESSKTVLGDLVAVVCRVRRLARMGVGSMTMHREDLDRGLEPDEGFYIGKKSVSLVLGHRDYDPYRDPPPDLIIEVDITSSSLKRLDIYRQLRVGEIWRYDGQIVTIFLLEKMGEYKESRRSRLFPFLSAGDLTRFMAMRDTKNDTELELLFEKWLRSRIAKKKR
jgi:Uma2 family endonuclease